MVAGFGFVNGGAKPGENLLVFGKVVAGSTGGQVVRVEMFRPPSHTGVTSGPSVCRLVAVENLVKRHRFTVQT